MEGELKTASMSMFVTECLMLTVDCCLWSGIVAVRCCGCARR